MTTSSENTIAAAAGSSRQQPAAVSPCPSAPVPREKCVVPLFFVLLCGLLRNSSSVSHTTPSSALMVLAFAGPSPINRRLFPVRIIVFCSSRPTVTFSYLSLGTWHSLPRGCGASFDHLASGADIPFSFAYILPMQWFGSSITPEQRSIPKKVFAVMGALDGLSGIMQIFASTYLGGSLIILLTQAWDRYLRQYHLSRSRNSYMASCRSVVVDLCCRPLL